MNAWHPDGNKCPAIKQNHEFANPLWQTVKWADSAQGREALSRTPPIKFAYVGSSSKYIDRGLNAESDWEGFEVSYLNSIGKGCVTNIIIPFDFNKNNNLCHLSLQKSHRLTMRSLVDTGADLSFISKRMAEEVLRRNSGIRGKGSYRVMDAFLKSHIFNENLTIDFLFEDLINSNVYTLFSIRLVIVDIPFSCDVIIGLNDIQRIEVFTLLPGLVRRPKELEEIESEEEEEAECPRVYKPTKLCNIYEAEWIDEGPYVRVPGLIYDHDDDDLEEETEYESLLSAIDELSEGMENVSFGQRAYERDDISEMDHDRFEAFPPEAIQEHKPTIPTKIFGPEELREALKFLLMKYQDVFSKEVKSEAAKVSPMVIEVDLKLWQTSRNRLPPRRLGRLRDAELNRQCRILLERGVIRLSRASYYSHAFLVPKHNGDWRFVLDFQGLNRSTTNVERWPIPNIGEMLRNIGDKRPKYFCVMDLTSGFYQAPVAEESRYLTAFITSDGVYEWTRVAMGKMSAPSYFQRVIATEVLGGLLHTICELYIDDILVFGRTTSEILENTERVLRRLSECGITVNPDKCSFGLSEVEYVGHTISGEGIHFTREKLDSVNCFVLPRTQKDMKQFLGLVNYFRDHMRGASVLMQPLHELVRNYHPKRVIEYSRETLRSFELVKEAIDRCPMLYFLDDCSEVRLFTDACNTGMGAYLCQIRDGKEFPIAFLSKAFDDRLRKWCTFQQEGFAIYYAMKKWRHLLLDRKFILMTDHANLTYLKGSSDPKVLRWMVSVQEFDFSVVHVKGKDNVVADAFSRLCVLRSSRSVAKDSGRKRKAEIPAEVIGTRQSLRLKKRVADREEMEAQEVPLDTTSNNPTRTVLEGVEGETDGVEEKATESSEEPMEAERRKLGTETSDGGLPGKEEILINSDEVIILRNEEQKEDADPKGEVGNTLDIDGLKRGGGETDSDEVSILGGGERKEEADLAVENTKPASDITPKVLGWFNAVHNAFAGHIGVDETTRRLFELPEVRSKALRGSLPKLLTKWIESLVRFCPTCAKNRVMKPKNVASHFACSSYVKMSRIAIDYIESLRPDDKGNDMIIVIIDCFSRWVSLTAVQSKSTCAFADAYVAWLGLCFGEPSEILTDRGTQFTSNLTDQLASVAGGRMIFTTAGSKQENAIVERANREVMRHLRNIIMDRRAMDEWGRYLAFVQRIMNTMVHSSTGVKPCVIVLSTEMSHETLKTLTNSEGSSEDTPMPESLEWEDKWIERLLERQKWYIQKAVDSLKSMDDHNRLAYPAITTHYDTGSLVLCEQGTAFRRGPEHKLLPYLSGPFEVMTSEGDTYTIRNIITNKLRHLHISNLHPYTDDGNHLPPVFAAVSDMGGFYLVDHVIRADPANHVKKKKLRDLRFLVRWLGYSEKFDTWETWTTLLRVPQLRTFLENHPLKRYKDLVVDLPILEGAEEDK